MAALLFIPRTDVVASTETDAANVTLRARLSCERLDDLAHVAAGSWGCCSCRTFNGGQRSECKHCGHRRCGG